MNYHLLIDHWFVDDFISAAEKITPEANRYILTFDPPTKYVKSNLGVYAPFGSERLDVILKEITHHDRVYVHWFHAPVMEVVNRLAPQVSLYLVFWGGDFIGNTRRFFNSNYDSLTKKYLRGLEKTTFFNARNPFDYARLVLKNIKKNISKRVHSMKEISIRRSFMRRLDYFCHWNDLDMDIVTSAYGGNPKFLHFFYGGGFDIIPDPKSVKKPVNSIINIWLGNSDTPTNNHLEAIEALSNYKDNKISITCPLSYGAVAYGDFVSKKGNEVFGSKWTSIRNHMSMEKYLEVQENADVVVMYHNRSQASGNIIAFIRMGKKVYLKKQSTLFALMKRNGILVFDANGIKNMSFEAFSEPLTEEQVQLNKKLITKLFSEEDKIDGYKRILL